MGLVACFPMPGMLDEAVRSQSVEEAKCHTKFVFIFVVSHILHNVRQFRL
jgi:hypothetical protein